MAAWIEVIRQWVRVHIYRTRVAAAKTMQPTLSPMRRKVPNPEYHQTAADALDWLVQRYAATYRIMRENDGVLVLLQLPDQSVISSGLRSSTALAVAALVEKLNANR